MQPTVGTEVSGNTKPDTFEITSENSGKKFRNWFFTIFSFDVETELKFSEKGISYSIYQIEACPTTGREHIQGLICYTNPRIWPKKKFPTGNLSIARNVQDCIKYCSKLESRVRGPYEFGTAPLGQGSRSDLDSIGQRVLNGDSLRTIAIDNPGHFIRYHRGLSALLAINVPLEERISENFWFWGPSGTKKTRTAYEMNKDCYFKDNTPWWDGYVGQENIIIDDFDSSKWNFRELLQILDRYPKRVQVKGGYVPLANKKIFITCEFPPSQLWGMDGLSGQNELNQVTRRLTEIREFKKEPSA